MSILDVQGLQKTYVGRFGKNKTEVLKNINFTVEKGNMWRSWVSPAPVRQRCLT